MMSDEYDWKDSNTIFGKFHKLLFENLPEDLNTDLISGLSKNDTVSLIQKFYQGRENEPKKELAKRKREDESCDMKKLKVCYKESDDSISALEMLPNEIYEKILKPLNFQDKKNLRTVSKSLHQKTTVMSSMFYGDWCFDLSKGTPPDIVMKSDRMFQITCNVEKETQINVYKKLINSLANRITSLSVTDFVDDELPLHNLLKDIEPAKFANVTSLFLEFCEIDNQCLLLLAPQLESLYLDQICTEFDLSNVTTTSEDESFTRLKSLTLKVVYIDVLKIVEKCSTTLQFLELEFDQHMMKQNTVWSLINFQDLEHDLRSLKSLNVFVDMVEELPGVQNLLSKACRSLVKLDMGFSNLLQLVDLSTLVEHEQSLIIKSLDLKLYSNVNNVNKFLKKCPLTQNLTLEGYEKRIKKVELNNLSTLTLSNCGIKCTRSMLKLVAKTKLRNLHLFAAYDLQMPDLHVISSLDKVSITFGFLLNSEEVDKLTRLFPREEKVNREVVILPNERFISIVFTRV